MANYMNNFQNTAMPQVGPNTVNPVSPLPPQQMNAAPFMGQQFILPQPVGNVYNLNNSNEIGNVPAGLGMSLGLCLNENLLYIKTLQNNAPAVLAYKLVPYEIQNNASANNQNDVAPVQENDEVKKLSEKLNRIEELLTKKLGDGGNQKWQL